MAETTVQRGDSFWKIAERELGDGSRWKEIADANGMQKGSVIHPGQTLVLPESSRTGSVPIPRMRPELPATPVAAGTPTTGYEPPTEPFVSGPREYDDVIAGQAGMKNRLAEALMGGQADMDEGRARMRAGMTQEPVDVRGARNTLDTTQPPLPVGPFDAGGFAPSPEGTAGGDPLMEYVRALLADNPRPVPVMDEKRMQALLMGGGR